MESNHVFDEKELEVLTKEKVRNDYNEALNKESQDDCLNLVFILKDV